MGVDGFYLGIDGGGTKCRATLSTLDGHVLGQGLGGPANPVQNIQRTIESIEAATDQVIHVCSLDDTDVKRISAGIGLAGVNLPTFYRAVNEWQHPFKHMFLTTDLEIACIGAHNGADGAVIVAGTGSSGFSTLNGRDEIFGAHGFPFGDKGSGAWIGLEAIKAVLLAMDGLGPATSLTESINGLVETDDLSIVEKYAGAQTSVFASLAGLVFDAAEAKDKVAIAIVENGVGYLGNLAKRLWDYQPPRMSLLGGLRQRIKPWLEPGIVEKLSPPIHQPDVGALIYAHRQLNEVVHQSADFARLRVS